jgi:hypothetical protein
MNRILTLCSCAPPFSRAKQKTIMEWFRSTNITTTADAAAIGTSSNQHQNETLQTMLLSLSQNIPLMLIVDRLRAASGLSFFNNNNSNLASTAVSLLTAVIGAIFPRWKEAALGIAVMLLISGITWTLASTAVQWMRYLCQPLIWVLRLIWIAMRCSGRFAGPFLMYFVRCAATSLLFYFMGVYWKRLIPETAVDSTINSFEATLAQQQQRQFASSADAAAAAAMDSMSTTNSSFSLFGFRFF